MWLGFLSCALLLRCSYDLCSLHRQMQQNLEHLSGNIFTRVSSLLCRPSGGWSAAPTRAPRLRPPQLGSGTFPLAGFSLIVRAVAPRDPAPSSWSRSVRQLFQSSPLEPGHAAATSHWVVLRLSLGIKPFHSLAAVAELPTELLTTGELLSDAAAPSTVPLHHSFCSTSLFLVFDFVLCYFLPSLKRLRLVARETNSQTSQSKCCIACCWGHQSGLL